MKKFNTDRSEKKYKILRFSRHMMTSLESEIQTLASSIAALKTEHPKSELIPEKVEKLKALKKQLALKLVQPEKKFNRSALESTLLKRFFFAPSFEIYGGKCNH